MDYGTIFCPTSKSQVLGAAADSPLSIVERRLLVLTDGRRTLTDLAAKVRFDDLVPAIERLLELGLIAESTSSAVLDAPVRSGFAAAQPGQAPRAANNPEAFYAVRQAASQALRSHMFHTADVLCAQVEQCEDPIALRKTLRALDGAQTERIYIDALRALARQYGGLLL